jgi:ZIP family zinc transporter
MNNIAQIALGLTVPFLGTALGAGSALFMRREMPTWMARLLPGFASGVMIAASVWSLLIPSITMAEGLAVPSWFPAAVGFACGIGFLLLLDYVIPHLHPGSDAPEGRRSKLGRMAMLVFAITLHNIPEGMAVGVVYAGTETGGAGITLADALALSVGIALQNLPEGAIISLPLAQAGKSRLKAFLYGVMSGIVEPLGALLMIAMTGLIEPALPYILAFAAGAMIYVVADELIPEAQAGEKHSNIGTIGVAAGFVLMMVLDTALG